MNPDDASRQPIDGEFPKPLLLGCVAAIIGMCAAMKYLVPPIVAMIGIDLHLG